MKKIMIMTLALAATFASAFAASVDFPIESKTEENLSQNFRIVNACNVADSELVEMIEGKHPEMAVEFSAQTILPIQFFLKGDLINLMGSEVDLASVKVKKTFYVRYVGKDLIFSTNLTDWKPFAEFAMGNASVALRVQEGRSSLVVGAEINRRS